MLGPLGENEAETGDGAADETLVQEEGGDGGRKSAVTTDSRAALAASVVVVVVVVRLSAGHGFVVAPRRYFTTMPRLSKAQNSE